MSNPPNTKDWQAQEGTDFGGGNRMLRVSGEVEVTNTGSTPQLAESDTTPINERILMLDLSIRMGGGGDVMNYKTARYEKPVSEDQYEQVKISYDGKEIESIPVEKIIS